MRTLPSSAGLCAPPTGAPPVILSPSLSKPTYDTAYCVVFYTVSLDGLGLEPPLLIQCIARLLVKKQTKNYVQNNDSRTQTRLQALLLILLVS